MSPSTSTFDPKLTKSEFYDALFDQLTSLLNGQRFWVTNLANASALIFHGLNSLDIFRDKEVNWVGFYLVDVNNPSHLLLGPFQGKVACTLIQFGKGVCGTAALTRQIQIVTDVHQCPGHIACDPDSKSEIVVPLISSLEDKVILGVLDIDCRNTAAFDEEDAQGLQKVSDLIVASSDWPLLSE